MKRLLPRSLACVILLTTCTIIEDEHITDPNVDFTLESISISQAGQEGTNNYVDATVTTTGGLIRQIDWQLQPIPNNDTNIYTFRFRTGIFLSIANLQSTAFVTAVDGSERQVTTFFEDYDANNSVGTIRNETPSSGFETYSFEYDSQRRVVSVTTTYSRNIVIQLQDQITYDFDSNIDFIHRTVVVDGNTSQSAIYVGFGRQSGGRNFSGTDDDIGGIVIQELPQGAAIPNKDDVVFANVDPNDITYFQNDPGNWFGGRQGDGFQTLLFGGNVDMLINDVGTSIASIELTDLRFFGNGLFQNESDNSPLVGARNRFPDFYYFHPFFLFPNLFEDGMLLQQLYFADWWIINQGTGNSYEFLQNRDMTIEFFLAK